MTRDNVLKALWFISVTVVGLAFFWVVVLKLVSRLAARFGKSSPCPASLSWIIDNPVRRRYMRSVLDQAGICAGERVLELGSGTGVFTADAARRVQPGGRLFALDIQPAMIAEVELRVRRAGLDNVEARVADAHHLPLDDASVDRALLITVLPEIPDRRRALAELHRVLRNPDPAQGKGGGVLSITEEFLDPDYLFSFETARLVEAAGFRLEQQFGNWFVYTANFRKTSAVPADFDPDGGQMNVAEDFYTSREERLLEEFDRTAERVKGVLVSRYGADLTATMIGETRNEYQALIPQLPYIGGKQPFTQFLISTAWFLAMYRVLRKHGETVEQVGRLLYEASEVFLKVYPGFLHRFFGQMTFSRLYLRRLQKRAAESRKRKYPGDYVYTFVKGDGETFDYGVDYVECAACKFLGAQGAAELAPYLCAADRLYSEMLGWGLVRTATLAEGAPKCDFRFKKGGPTKVAVPKALEQH